MATASPGRGNAGGGIALATGDHMTREEFHRAYAATPDDFRAELIGGIVYVPSLRRFDLRAGRELEAAADGIVRLGAAPGLWVDVAALFANDYPGLMTALEHGLTTPEHAEFIRRLAAR